MPLGAEILQRIFRAPLNGEGPEPPAGVFQPVGQVGTGVRPELQGAA
jgi:hypothetical protein